LCDDKAVDDRHYAGVVDYTASREAISVNSLIAENSTNVLADAIVQKAADDSKMSNSTSQTSSRRD
ncbi:hypothetical protein FRC17_003971, partial [Serendipita sp. 399]